MEEQASQHKGGRDPFHLAPHPNLDGLPDPRVSILPDFLAEPVDNRGSIRQGIAAGKACFTFCFPSHPPQLRSVRSVVLAQPSGPLHSTKDRGILVDFSGPWVAHLLTAHVPAAHHKQSHRNRRGRHSSSAGQRSQSIKSMVRISSPHEHTLPGPGSSISFTLHRPPANCCPHSAKISIPPARRIPPGSELLNHTQVWPVTTWWNLRCLHAIVMQLAVL